MTEKERQKMIRKLTASIEQEYTRRLEHLLEEAMKLCREDGLEREVVVPDPANPWRSNVWRVTGYTKALSGQQKRTSHDQLFYAIQSYKEEDTLCNQQKS